MKRIVLIGTGGTIAEMDREGVPVLLDASQLLESVPSIQSVASVRAMNFVSVPSACIDFKTMLGLGRLIEKVIATEPPDGIVVTTGTDTLEESAYFLSLVVRSEIPIIVSGAMRSRLVLGSDAEYNLRNAVLAASSDDLRGMGVVVTMNGELHHSRYVTKTNTTSYSAFQSPGQGPLGIIVDDSIRIFRMTVSSEHIRPNEIDCRVDLIKCGMDMDGSLLEAAIGLGAKGIVVEAFGGGDVTPALASSIRMAIDREVTVVITSRCSSGHLSEPSFDFVGSARYLSKVGAIRGDGLSGVKARIKLVLALSCRMSLEEMRQLFEGASS